MEKVYLCHKCSGLLSKNTTRLPLHGCGCISGYIRDGQIPFTELEAWAYVVNDTIRDIEWLERRNADGDSPKVEKLLDRLQLFATNPPEGIEKWDGCVPSIFEGMKPYKANFEYIDSHILYSN